MNRNKRKTLKESPVSFERYIHKHYRSDREFAKDLGVCHTNLSKWLNGKSAPSKGHIREIAAKTKGKFNPNYWILDFPKEVEKRLELLKIQLTDKSIETMPPTESSITPSTCSSST